MASPTAIEVVVDAAEYSRYEPGRDKVTATVIATGTDFVDEVVRVDFVKARRSRDAVVASTTLTFNGDSPQVQDVVFELPNIVDADLFSLVKRGMYFVRATSLSDVDVVGESADFRLSIITVEKFKADYLFGVPLTATNVKAVKFQPQSITGVEIIEVSAGTFPGFGTLTYTYTETPSIRRTLSWRGGPQVLITAPGTYTLRAGSSTPGGCSGAVSGDYIVVKIRSLAILPTETIMEDLLIEQKSIADSTFADYIERTCSWIERDLLHSYLEPTQVVTERDATTIQYGNNTSFPQALYLDTDFDEIVNPLTWFAPKRGNWITINTPFMQLLRVDMLYGAQATVRVLDVDLDWCQISGPGGMIQLIPYNNIIGFTYMGPIWNNAINTWSEIPNFWHFSMLAGLRDVTPDLMELIAKKSAIDALIVLGAAFRPGMGSISLGRDGVSQSVSLLSTQKYGPFTGPIAAFTEWFERELPRYKAKYRGSLVTVV